MNRLQSAVAVLCIAAVGGLAWGQAAAPQGAPVLEAIPAGTAGFVAVNNLEQTLGAVQQYLKAIGVTDLAPIPPDLLGALKGAAQLGEGFNPKGGLALILLDPTPLGIDLTAMLDGRRAPTPDQLPIAVLVPATGGVAEVFGPYMPPGARPEGDVVQLNLPNLPVQAAKVGGYIALSPSAKALAAVTGARKNAASEMTKEQLELMARSHLGVHVNMKVVGPLYVKFLDKMMTAGPMAGMPPPLAGMMKAYSGLYASMVKQVQGVCLGLRFSETGLVFEEVAAMVPDSAMGKALASMAGRGPAALDRLPNLPYVLALGAVGGGEAASQPDAEAVEAFLKAIPNLPPQAVEKLKRVNTQMNSEVTATQFVIGGAPAGSGVFGLSCVMTCKDAEKVKASLADVTDAAGQILKAVIPEEEVAKLQIAYNKGVEKSGSVSVDAIELRHPEMDSMDDDEKAEMAKVLGEGRIRFLVAAPDKTTVVLTFGGSTTFLAEALKVAGGGGTIGKEAGVVEAMKVLPKDPVMVCVLSGANLISVIRKAAETMGAGDEFPPIVISATTPVAMGASVSGANVHAVVYVPNQLVKEIIGIAGQFMMGGRRGPGPRPPVGETF